MLQCSYANFSNRLAYGNLTIDQNKGIVSEMSYSYQNKPVHIEVQNKGTVDYLYDAVGNRLRKTVYDQAANTTRVTEYDGPFVYEDNLLHHILTEEGRCRPKALAVNGKASFEYDYFVKDHLQNVRTVVNAQVSGLGSIFSYHTGLEVASAKKESLVWSHLDDVRQSTPQSTGSNDTYAAELDGSIPGQTIGTAVMLRVMPGDRFEVSGRSYYQAVNQNNANNAQQFASALFGALSGGTLYNNIPVSETPQNMIVLQNTVGSPAFATAYDNLVNNSTDPLYPASHLNYIFFNEQFEMLQSQSGAMQCGATPNQWNTISTASQIEIGEPGYILVFTGSKVNSPVFWDAIDVIHYKGVVLEENHYYPFGLTLTNATNNAAEQNRLRLTTKELQGADEHDLNWYDFGARMQDMQIGRWNGIDEKSEKYLAFSPYNYCLNSPTKYIDPDGKQVDIRPVYLENGELSGVNISITGKIVIRDGVNNTDRNNRLVNSFNAQANKAWTKTLSNGVQVKMDSKFTLAANEKDISANDHVIYIDRRLPEEINEDHQTAASVNRLGGRVMYSTRIGELGHEIGHWLGLAHPTDYTELLQFGLKRSNLPADEVNGMFPNNIMLGPGTAGTSSFSNDYTAIQQRQVKMIIDAFNKSLLNIGSNDYIPKNVGKYDIVPYQRLIIPYINAQY